MKIKAILFFSFYSFFLFGQEFTTSIPGGNSFGESVYQDEEGNFYCAAAIAENNQQKSTVLKFDKNGNQLWKKSFDGEFSSGGACFSLFPTDDGNFITHTFNIEDIDFFSFYPDIIKFDSNGDTIWRKFMYPEPVPDDEVMMTMGEIIKLEDGDFLFYGDYESIFGISGMGIVKFNQEGDQLWSTVIGWVDEFTSGQAVTVGNKIYVLTSSNHFGTGERLNRLSKLDYDGNLIEEIMVSHDFSRLFRTPLGTSKSEILYSISNVDTTYINNIDTTGQLVWQSELILDQNQVFGIVKTFENNDGGFRSLGIFQPALGTFDNTHPVILDFDTNGNLVDSISIKDIDSQPVLGFDGFFLGDTVVLTGSIRRSTNSSDFLISKKSFGEVSSAHNNFQNQIGFEILGNPAKSDAILKFDYSESRIIQIFDANGILLSDFDSNSNQVQLLRNNLPNGAYFVKVSNMEGQYGTGKIIFN